MTKVVTPPEPPKQIEKKVEEAFSSFYVIIFLYISVVEY